MRTLFCLLFILTNAVMAQAAETGALHIDTQKWITTHVGEGEVDGLPVTAQLEESPISLEIPGAMAAAPGDDTMVPTLNPIVKKSYRLNLLVSQSPRIQFAYPVEARRVSLDGAVRFAYVSDLDPGKDIHFVITTEADGALHVTYARKATSGVVTGDFRLTSVPHILSR